MDLRSAWLPALVGLVVGLAVGWFVAPRQAPTESTLEADDAGAGDAAGQPHLGTDNARLAAASRELAAETERREAAEQALAEVREQLAERAEGAAPGAAGTTPGKAGVRYRYDAFDATLSQIDWQGAGEAISKMSPLLAELASTMMEGKPMPPSVGDIQKYNGPLVKLALTAQQQGMPGTGTNGAFTHPSILANLVYSTLREAGLPLSPGQEARLAEIADDAVRDDARRLAGYGPETLELQKVWDETQLKDRFYDGVDRLVTDEQREVLHPVALRGRLSFDLFSSGLVWMGLCAARRFTQPEQLQLGIVDYAMNRFELPVELKPILEDVVAEWVAGFPAGYLDEPADALELGGRLRISRVRIAAERQLGMMRRLLDRLPAGSPAAAKIRSEPTVAVPVRTP